MQKYVIGNWKSNKTVSEAIQWVDGFAPLYQKESLGPQPVVVGICAQFIHLWELSARFKKQIPDVFLGAQDVSPFPSGAYTGAVSASVLTGMVTHTIIGHSERRKYFHEDDEQLGKKVEQATANNLTPIYCVPDAQTKIPQGVSMVAYEPVAAIGSGEAQSPDVAISVVRTIREKGASSILYGGSVKPDNVSSYLLTDAIDGVLIGGASLDPMQFWELIRHASGI